MSNKTGQCHTVSNLLSQKRGTPSTVYWCAMTFVVGEDCIKCKHTDCVEVCPVDCFYEGPNFLVIHPDECIDCALCEPECPIDAIFSEDELPSDQENFLELNAELAEIWPNITEKKDRRHFKIWL